MSVLATRDPFGTLGQRIIEDSQNNDLDAKVIITSHNSRPGLGKTTLAIKMARSWDPHGWSAEEKACMSASKYHEAYKDVKPGSVLLFDEIEEEADSRRSMSNKNRELSQAWAQNRYRNVVTICTLPTVSMLDKRMLELSDYWINVITRGLAHPYEILVNDFNGNIVRRRLDEDAKIIFTDLKNGDPDYEYLKDLKHRRREHKDSYYTQDELDEAVKKAKKDTRMDCRNEWLVALAQQSQLSVRQVAELDIVDVSRPRVHQIINELTD